MYGHNIPFSCIHVVFFYQIAAIFAKYISSVPLPPQNYLNLTLPIIYIILLKNYLTLNPSDYLHNFVKTTTYGFFHLQLQYFIYLTLD